MKKLVLLQGLPWAWKSTYAKKEVEEKWAMRFNKDEIRKEGNLFPAGYFYSKENEEIVMKTERERVEIAMFVVQAPYIIIDNTHLDQRDWTENKHISFYKQLAKKYGYKVEVKQFYVTVEEAIERDLNRNIDEQVWEKVIRKMEKAHKLPKQYPANPTFRDLEEGLPYAIIVDIDGTLAFMDWKRSPYDYGRVDWDRFNYYLWLLINCFLIWISQSIKQELKILIVSWRKDECREITIEWLKNKGMIYNELYMRNNDDNRCDSIVKEEIYREHIEGKYNVLAVFDDRDRVCDLWRLKLQLPCYQVWYSPD